MQTGFSLSARQNSKRRKYKLTFSVFSLSLVCHLPKTNSTDSKCSHTACYAALSQGRPVSTETDPYQWGLGRGNQQGWSQETVIGSKRNDKTFTEIVTWGTFSELRSLFFFRFILLCECFVWVCVWAHVCAWSPGTEAMVVVSHDLDTGELDPGPQQEQLTLLTTKPSLQSLKLLCLKNKSLIFASEDSGARCWSESLLAQRCWKST